MTFLTDIKAKDSERSAFTGRPLNQKGVLDYVSREDMFELMRLVTDAVFKNEKVMAELLLIDDEEAFEDGGYAPG